MTISTRSTNDRPSSPHQPVIARAAATRLTPYKDPLKIPPLLHPTKFGAISLANINMRVISAKLHSELPATKLWAYDDVFPGPTIVVRRGERVRISWTNQLSGSYPITSVQVPFAPPPFVPFKALLEPGRSGAKPNPDVANLVPWTVVHLHGARTGGDNDGWPENGVSPGDAQLSEYPNDQEATALWYHDHAMAITRFNVVTGLVGMYLIRDEQEDALHLPRGLREIPLILCDRNLDTHPDGTFNGAILHKTAVVSESGLATPYFGPFNLVNGVITPHLDVSAAWYRFRVLNAANARDYVLRLCDGTTPLTGAMVQIGTDGGLLPAPLPIEELRLAPAERADILINFAAFHGKRLQLRNFGPSTVNAAGGDDVMELRVSAFPAIDPFVLPPKLSKSYVRYDHNNGTIPSHEHRYVVITPVEFGHPKLWEMEEVGSAVTGPDIVEVNDVVQDAAGNELKRVSIRLRKVAEHFGDTLSFRVEEGMFEIWNFIHLGPGPYGNFPGNPMHPLHIHLVEFQALNRISGAVLEGGKPVFNGVGTTHPIDFVRKNIPDEHLLPNETGWKDVIRVEAGTWVRVAAKFEGAHGRYVYHCHILDHEDQGMMRPFTVMPPSVAKLDMEHKAPHHA